MRLTLIPDLSREQDKSSLLRPTNIWLKSRTERPHGVVLEYVDRDIKKNLTWVEITLEPQKVHLNISALVVGSSTRKDK